MLGCDIHHDGDDVGGLLRFSQYAVRLGRQNGRWMAARDWTWHLFPADAWSDWICGFPDLVFGSCHCFTESLGLFKELM